MPRPSFAPAGRSRCSPAGPRRGRPRGCRSKPAWGRSPASPTTSRFRRATGPGRPRALYARVPRLGNRPRQPDRPRRGLPLPPRGGRIGGTPEMRFSNLVFVLAALCLATVRPVYAEETVNGPVYIVTYFDVAPTSAQQSAGDRSGIRRCEPQGGRQCRLRGIRRNWPAEPVRDAGGLARQEGRGRAQRGYRLRPHSATSFSR